METTPTCALPASRAFSDVGDGDKVRMVFPHNTLLLLNHNRKVFFAAGVRLVPKDLADHWWLKANGMVAAQ
jgi:hypothetical protein